MIKCSGTRGRRLGKGGRGVNGEQWQIILKLHDYRCAYCGCASNRLTMDHVLALSNGGLHDIENIVPACV